MQSTWQRDPGVEDVVKGRIGQLPRRRVQGISGSASYTYVNVVICRCGNIYWTVYSRNYRNTLKSAGFRNL